MMLCISAGANLFAAAQSRGVSVGSIMTITLSLSFGSMALPFLSSSYPPSFALVLAAFCIFEAACGAFMPGMGVLRSELIPSSLQSTMMTAYRSRTRAHIPTKLARLHQHIAAPCAAICSDLSTARAGEQACRSTPWSSS